LSEGQELSTVWKTRVVGSRVLYFYSSLTGEGREMQHTMITSLIKQHVVMTQMEND
jgi:hypothetical protein